MTLNQSKKPNKRMRKTLTPQKVIKKKAMITRKRMRRKRILL